MRALSGILCVLALGACSTSEAAPPADAQAPPVGVIPVLVRDVVLWDDFTGRVESPHAVNVQPRVSGYVERIPAREGVEVNQGDLLFVIDPRPFRAELAQARANVQRAKTQVTLTRNEARRGVVLKAEKVITGEEYETRQANAAQAEADLKASEGALDIAELNLQFTEVRAPLAGRIGRSLVTVGDFVTGGTPSSTTLTTLVTEEPIWVYFECDEQTFLEYDDRARRGEGPRARDQNLTALVARATDEGFPFRGRVDFVDNQVDPSTGTIRLRVVLPNAERAFTPGLYARVRLQGRGTARSLLVDEKSILSDQDRKYVYVEKDGRAKRRDVEVGRAVGRFRIVEKGLAKGDRVIARGVQRVRPDMPVAPELIVVSDPSETKAEGAPTPPAPAEPGR